jgi:plastocyanin
VKRLVALAVALALAAVLALPAGQARVQTEQAAAAECLWERQAKRVVKQVRRQGRVRRVVRRRHRWVCVPQATPPAMAPAPAPPSPPLQTTPLSPPTASEPEPEANRLAVKAMEFFLILSRPSVRPGQVTIELNNQGEDPHNLNIRREGEEGAPEEIPETQAQQREVASFDLPAGKYRLWCSLPEHEGWGMHTTLRVE